MTTARATHPFDHTTRLSSRQVIGPARMNKSRICPLQEMGPPARRRPQVVIPQAAAVAIGRQLCAHRRQASAHRFI